MHIKVQKQNECYEHEIENRSLSDHKALVTFLSQRPFENEKMLLNGHRSFEQSKRLNEAYEWLSTPQRCKH